MQVLGPVQGLALARARARARAQGRVQGQERAQERAQVQVQGQVQGQGQGQGQGQAQAQLRWKNPQRHRRNPATGCRPGRGRTNARAWVQGVVGSSQAPVRDRAAHVAGGRELAM